jgi:uncharacterized SAM-binding protein YcdF (DUF218 family)
VSASPAFELPGLGSPDVVRMRSPLMRLRSSRALMMVGALGMAYVGFNFLAVLIASGADHRDPVDAIVVLGAAQYDGQPSPIFQQRLDHAYSLWNEGTATLIVTTGSNQPGDRVTEGFAGFEYLRFEGVPEEALLIITDGASTWEQLAATTRQLRQLGHDSAVLVSDPYHALRLTQIADEVGLDASVSSTDSAISIRNLSRETAAVSLGRVLGYRRVDNWLGGVG